jgi:peroxiredoxin
MERLYRRLHKQGFEIVAVSVDEDPSVVESFRERLSISFPIVLDADQQVSRLYQTTGFPESLLIDEGGTVVERYVGPRDWAIYSDRIQRLISAGPAL